ncbi:TonB-linked SusC/RagA family outer membrane protein [Neolewinella xylanilytica]|uniref:TonB-linked SusC/RagA family outer membrane protein n=1 Tax=Neolewinella xylanilytica TaxID=1514080 RepID=A0A2S6I9L9_9BACT|nr:SusC/RagA family TonB-linked outer membrane protein [Neolewinella xylanilytica]PPK88195.1 TonB-linked SusC/RagA family outer membrane protein [Neolewinella xylanilytica]
MKPQKIRGVLSLLVLFLATSVWAQQLVTGTVTGDDGEPLIGVSVRIEGTGTGTVTDVDGTYSLTTQEGNTLIYSYTGYGTVSREVGTQTIIDVELVAGAQLDEVVVTALGISRERKALGYAVEEIESEQIERTQQNNLVNSLQGQVAGVQVTSAGGGPGQGARIIIRGINSLDPSANNEPLFVIDGIPVSNETLTAGGGAERNVSNRIADINPQDVESMTVLKGGPATALYGLRAANGAIIITTKRGQAGKLSVDFSTTYGTEEVNKFPETQRVYTQGYEGVYDPDSFWPSWGPTVEEARQYAEENGLPRPNDLFNNYENAFQQGNQWRHTLSVSGGDEKATFRTSISRLEHEGVLPFSDYENTSFRINANYVASEKFNFGGGVNYIRSGGNRVNADRFSTRLTYWAPQYDVNDYINEDGSMIGYQAGRTAGNNPIYGEATNKFIDDVDRYIGNLNFSYAPFPSLTFNYTIGLDQYSDFRQNYGRGSVYPGAPNFEDNLSNGNGFVVETRMRSRDVTSNINGIFTSTVLPDINMRFLAGFDVFDSSYDRVTTTGYDLDIYDLFSLNNAADIQTESNLRNRRLLGLYGDLSFDYRNAVYLTVTGRNDWSSTLPAANRSFFYPSVSLGLIMDELIELPSAISFFKIRTSYAGIGKDTDPYRTSIVYANPTGFPIEGVTGWSRGSQKGANDLKPERTNTFEIGTNLRFLQNRLSLDFTYYDAKSVDQIIPVPTSLTTGFSSFVLNAGSMRNRGVELMLKGSPVATENFLWDVTLNYTRNRNEVLEIYEGIEDIFIGDHFGYAGASATIRLIEGQPYGNIYGRSYARYGANDDDLFIDYSQPMLIGADGFPVIETTQKILGNTQPDWFGAIINNFTYKGLTFSFQIDTRQGVQKYNQQGNFFSAFGIAPYTLNREETIVFEGVTADGEPNTQAVYLGQGTGPDGRAYGAGYYRNTYRGSTENFVEDADWIRLRNVSISYQLPATLLENLFIDNVSLRVTGNNLWLDTPYSGFDPEGNRGNGNTDTGFGGFTYPGVRTVFFTLNVGF